MADNKKTLLLISGGIEAIPGILKAKALGLRVVVSDGAADAPGFKLADDTIIASTYDINQSIQQALEYHQTKHPIHGVICVASDVPHTVAHVAKALNLPGLPTKIAELSIDKLAMKARFLADHIPIPWFHQVESVEQLHQIQKNKSFDLVIKPVDSRGARGVLKLTQGINLEWAFQHALQFSPTQRVMVEKYLSGPQVSTESLVVNGKVFTPGFSDRNYEFLTRFAPHMIENGGDLPCHLSQQQQHAITDMIQCAVDSMKIKSGVVKGDIVWHDNQPCIIELATRLSGGYFCSHEIPLNTGVDFVGAAIKLAIGESVSEDDLRPKYQHYVCQRYFFPEPGRVLAVLGESDVASRDHVALCEVRVKPGDLIAETHSHPARAGLVITTGSSRQLAQQHAITAVQDIKIITECL